MKEFITKKEISDATIIAHSLGGMISLYLTIKYSKIVKKLVIVDSLPFFRQKMPEELIKNLSEDDILKLFSERLSIPSHKIPKHELERYENLKKWSLQRRRQAITGKMLKHYFKGLKNFDLKDKLREIAVPTLVIFGEDDRLLNQDVLNYYRKIPQCTIKIIKNCGHSPPRERINEFNESISSFFREK